MWGERVHGSGPGAGDHGAVHVGLHTHTSEWRMLFPSLLSSLSGIVVSATCRVSVDAAGGCSRTFHFWCRVGASRLPGALPMTHRGDTVTVQGDGLLGARRFTISYFPPPQGWVSGYKEENFHLFHLYCQLTDLVYIF